MSYISGIFQTNGNDIKADLDLMEQRSQDYIFVNKTKWSNEQIGLFNGLRYLSPESVFEKQPYTLNSYTITSNARIDNRQELFNLLNVPKNEQNEIPDSVLILKAYIKWQEKCVSYLEGDWTFAIWNNENKTLFIAKDHLGNTGVYYHKSDNLFVFASTLNSILAHPKINPKINDLYLAGISVGWRPEDGESIYKGIYHLPPGHFLTISETHFEKTRYWFPENTKLLHLKSKEDYIEGLLDLYSNAIKARMRYGKVGSMLSGGLDSGSIVAIAAKYLNESNQKLSTYTHEPFYEASNMVHQSSYANESELAKATAHFAGNVEMNFIKKENVSIIDSIQKIIDIHSMPTHASGNSYWLTELFSKAQYDGNNTLFSGQGGNATISWTGLPQTNNLLNDFQRLIKGNISIERFTKNSAKKIISKQFLKNKKIKKIQTSVFNKEFLNEIKLNDDLMHIDYPSVYKTKSEPILQRMAILKPHITTIGQLKQNQIYNYNLNIVDPAKDKKVIEFCLAIPNNFFRNDNFDRLIMRDMMKNILPEKVRLNSSRGVQGADIQFRVQKYYSEIKDLLIQFKSIDKVAYYLNIDEMMSILEEIYKNPSSKNQANCNSVLLRGIGIGLFLKTHFN